LTKTKIRGKFESTKTPIENQKIPIGNLKSTKTL